MSPSADGGSAGSTSAFRSSACRTVCPCGLGAEVEAGAVDHTAQVEFRGPGVSEQADGLRPATGVRHHGNVDPGPRGEPLCPAACRQDDSITRADLASGQGDGHSVRPVVDGYDLADRVCGSVSLGVRQQVVHEEVRQHVSLAGEVRDGRDGRRDAEAACDPRCFVGGDPVCGVVEGPESFHVVGEPPLVRGVRPLQRPAGEVRRCAAQLLGEPGVLLHPREVQAVVVRVGLPAGVGPGEGGRGRSPRRLPADRAGERSRRRGQAALRRSRRAPSAPMMMTFIVCVSPFWKRHVAHLAGTGSSRKNSAVPGRTRVVTTSTVLPSSARNSLRLISAGVPASLCSSVASCSSRVTGSR